MRAPLLLERMGEGDGGAGMLVQDVDPANYTQPLLTDAAVAAYIATADFTGICPVVMAAAQRHRASDGAVAGAARDLR